MAVTIANILSFDLTHYEIVSYETMALMRREEREIFFFRSSQSNIIILIRQNALILRHIVFRLKKLVKCYGIMKIESQMSVFVYKP